MGAICLETFLRVQLTDQDTRHQSFTEMIKLDSTSYLQSVFYLQPETGCFQLDLWKICKFWYWIINIWFVLSLQFEWNIFRDNPQTVLQKYFADAVFGAGRLAGALAGSRWSCFYSLGVDTDKNIEYSNMDISGYFTQYAASWGKTWKLSS